MFERAIRLKLRFKTTSGQLSIEDLWDLPLAFLNELAKALSREVKESAEESFIAKKSNTNAISELRFELVKHVIKVKLEEAETKEKAVENKAKKEHILSLIAEKQGEDLKSKSIDELTKLMEDL
jgi:hypothetical protein